MDPARMLKESLTSRPELENSQDPQQSLWASSLNSLIGWQNERSPHPSGDVPTAVENVVFQPKSMVALSSRRGKRLRPLARIGPASIRLLLSLCKSKDRKEISRPIVGSA
jgi:hypothetical protein